METNSKHNYFQQNYDRLNAEQKQAVDIIEGPVMVIAGAGTGKTQILALRIANILKETQIDPQNILCLTYTDTGMTAMRKRLIELIGDTAYHIKIFTFHAFCNDVISNNPEKFTFKKEAELIDDLEKIKLLQDILDKLDISSPLINSSDRYFYLKSIDNQIKNLKQEKILPDDLEKDCMEIASFLEQIEKIVGELINKKGRPDEAIVNETGAKTITFANPNNLEGLPALYLNYLLSLFEEYQKNLTGQKRIDGTLRTKYRNSLRALLFDLKENLPKQLELVKIYRSYLEKMHEAGRYDYEDMLLFVTEKFQKDADLLRLYQERYQYVLVDEYQDTNTAQNITVDLLGSFFDSPNLFVVGDDDQSIYRFQGASIENIIDYYQKYKSDLQIVTLTKNYRSQQTILDAATSMIAKNGTRIASFVNSIDKNLIAAKDIPKAKIELLGFENEHIENYGIIEKIKQLIADGVNPSEIAILYYKHHHADELIEMLSKSDVPYSVIAGLDILKDLQITKLLRLFKTIESPTQNDLLAECLFLDFMKIDASDTLMLLHQYSHSRLENKGFSLFSFLKNPNESEIKSLKISNENSHKDLMEKLAEWKELSQNVTITEFFQTVINESGYLDYLLNKGNRNQALNRLRRLFNEIKKSANKKHTLTITEFLENIEIRAANKLPLNEEPMQIDRKAVQLMSAHKAKGLEFEHVFIIKATEKNWLSTRPNQVKLPPGLVKRKISDEKLTNEEDLRRLFYVSMTRAKQKLYISYAEFRGEENKMRENIPVRFIKEIPDEYLEKIDTNIFQQESEQALANFFLPQNLSEMPAIEESFLKALAEKHTLSPTTLNNYLTCGRRFLYQNLIRIPSAKKPFLAMGTAIHDALDTFYRKYRSTKIKPSLDLMLMQFKTTLNKELLTKKDYEHRLKLGQKIIQEYFEAKQNEFKPDTITEYNFAGQGSNVDGVPITGKIDKIEYISENKVRLTDFKTGNTDSGITKTKHGEDYFRQLIFYKLLADLSPRFKLDIKAEATEGQIEFLEKSKKTSTLVTKTITFDQSDIDELKNTIKLVHQQISNLEFDKIDFCDTCDKCPFKGICWPEKPIHN